MGIGDVGTCLAAPTAPTSLAGIATAMAVSGDVIGPELLEVEVSSHGGHHLFINRIPPRLPKEDVEKIILAQLRLHPFVLQVSKCSVIPQNSLKNKGYGFITLDGCPSPTDLDAIANSLNNKLQVGCRTLGVRVCTDCHSALLGDDDGSGLGSSSSSSPPNEPGGCEAPESNVAASKQHQPGTLPLAAGRAHAPVSASAPLAPSVLHSANSAVAFAKNQTSTGGPATILLVSGSGPTSSRHRRRTASGRHPHEPLASDAGRCGQSGTSLQQPLQPQAAGRSSRMAPGSGSHPTASEGGRGRQGGRATQNLTPGNVVGRTRPFPIPFAVSRATQGPASGLSAPVASATKPTQLVGSNDGRLPAPADTHTDSGCTGVALGTCGLLQAYTTTIIATPLTCAASDLSSTPEQGQPPGVSGEQAAPSSSTATSPSPSASPPGAHLSPATQESSAAGDSLHPQPQHAAGILLEGKVEVSEGLGMGGDGGDAVVAVVAGGMVAATGASGGRGGGRGGDGVGGCSPRSISSSGSSLGSASVCGSSCGGSGGGAVPGEGGEGGVAGVAATTAERAGVESSSASSSSSSSRSRRYGLGSGAASGLGSARSLEGCGGAGAASSEGEESSEGATSSPHLTKTVAASTLPMAPPTSPGVGAVDTTLAVASGSQAAAVSVALEVRSRPSGSSPAGLLATSTRQQQHTSSSQQQRPNHIAATGTSATVSAAAGAASHHTALGVAGGSRPSFTGREPVALADTTAANRLHHPRTQPPPPPPAPPPPFQPLQVRYPPLPPHQSGTNPREAPWPPTPLAAAAAAPGLMGPPSAGPSSGTAPVGGGPCAGGPRALGPPPSASLAPPNSACSVAAGAATVVGASGSSSSAAFVSSGPRQPARGREGAPRGGVLAVAGGGGSADVGWSVDGPWDRQAVSPSQQQLPPPSAHQQRSQQHQHQLVYRQHYATVGGGGPVQGDSGGLRVGAAASGGVGPRGTHDQQPRPYQHTSPHLEPNSHHHRQQQLHAVQSLSASVPSSSSRYLLQQPPHRHRPHQPSVSHPQRQPQLPEHHTTKTHTQPRQAPHQQVAMVPQQLQRMPPSQSAAASSQSGPQQDLQQQQPRDAATKWGGASAAGAAQVSAGGGAVAPMPVFEKRSDVNYGSSDGGGVSRHGRRAAPQRQHPYQQHHQDQHHRQQQLQPYPHQDQLALSRQVAAWDSCGGANSNESGPGVGTGKAVSMMLGYLPVQRSSQQANETVAAAVAQVTVVPEQAQRGPGLRAAHAQTLNSSCSSTSTPHSAHCCPIKVAVSASPPPLGIQRAGDMPKQTHHRHSSSSKNSNAPAPLQPQQQQYPLYALLPDHPPSRPAASTTTSSATRTPTSAAITHTNMVYPPPPGATPPSGVSDRRLCGFGSTGVAIAPSAAGAPDTGLPGPLNAATLAPRPSPPPLASSFSSTSSSSPASAAAALIAAAEVAAAASSPLAPFRSAVGSGTTSMDGCMLSTAARAPPHTLPLPSSSDTSLLMLAPNATSSNASKFGTGGSMRGSDGAGSNALLGRGLPGAVSAAPAVADFSRTLEYLNPPHHTHTHHPLSVSLSGVCGSAALAAAASAWRPGSSLDLNALNLDGWRRLGPPGLGSSAGGIGTAGLSGVGLSGAEGACGLFELSGCTRQDAAVSALSVSCGVLGGAGPGGLLLAGAFAGMRRGSSEGYSHGEGACGGELGLLGGSWAAAGAHESRARRIVGEGLGIHGDMCDSEGDDDNLDPADLEPMILQLLENEDDHDMALMQPPLLPATTTEVAKAALLPPGHLAPAVGPLALAAATGGAAPKQQSLAAAAAAVQQRHQSLTHHPMASIVGTPLPPAVPDPHLPIGMGSSVPYHAYTSLSQPQHQKPQNTQQQCQHRSFYADEVALPPPPPSASSRGPPTTPMTSVDHPYPLTVEQHRHGAIHVALERWAAPRSKSSGGNGVGSAGRSAEGISHDAVCSLQGTYPRRPLAGCGGPRVRADGAAHPVTGGEPAEAAPPGGAWVGAPSGRPMQAECSRVGAGRYGRVSGLGGTGRGGAAATTRGGRGGGNRRGRGDTVGGGGGSGGGGGGWCSGGGRQWDVAVQGVGGGSRGGEAAAGEGRGGDGVLAANGSGASGGVGGCGSNGSLVANALPVVNVLMAMQRMRS